MGSSISFKMDHFDEAIICCKTGLTQLSGAVKRLEHNQFPTLFYFQGLLESEQAINYQVLIHTFNLTDPSISGIELKSQQT